MVYETVVSVLCRESGKTETACFRTPQLAQLARYVVKENYDFGFATVDHETYNESELEKALHENITALLLEMGNGFAFIGKQKEIIVGGRTRRIDLLFYHIRLRCFVKLVNGYISSDMKPLSAA